MFRKFLIFICMWIMFAFLLVELAEAQYFGQNKVQYEKFQYKVLKTDHFDIYYYPQEQQAIEYAAQIAERWYARLAKIFNHQLSSRQPLIMYASHPDFEQTNILEGDVNEGTGGVTESGRRRIILPFRDRSCDGS